MLQNGRWTKIGVIFTILFFVAQVSLNEPTKALLKGAVLGALILSAAMIIWKDFIIPKVKKFIRAIMEERNVKQD